MSGLNVLPLTSSVNKSEIKSFPGGNSFNLNLERKDFAALFKDLLLLNQEKGEGQTEEEDLFSLSELGIEGLLLTNPAGKEANSGINRSQETDQSGGNPIGQFLKTMAQEGLQTGMRQAGPAKGGIPQTELDQYKSKIIRLLQELNGKLEVVTKPTPTAVMMQAVAAAKVYPSEFYNTVPKSNAATAQLSSQTANQQLTDQVLIQTTKQPGIQGVNPAVNQEVNPAVKQAVNQVANQGVNQEINPEVKQVVNQVDRSASNVNIPLSPLKNSLGSQINYQRLNPLENQRGNQQGNQTNQPGNQPKNFLGQSFNESLLVKDNSVVANQQIPPKTENGPRGDATQPQDQGIDAPQLFVKDNEGLKSSPLAKTDKNSAPSLVQQIAQALQRQMEGLSETPSPRHLPQVDQVEIQLNPAELGKIRVSVRLEDGQVNLYINAKEAATGSLLQQQLGDLRQTLTNLGVAVGTFQMGLGEGQGNSQGFQENRQPYETRYEKTEIPEENVANEFSFYSEGIYGGSQVNVMA